MQWAVLHSKLNPHACAVPRPGSKRYSMTGVRSTSSNIPHDDRGLAPPDLPCSLGLLTAA